MHKKLAKALSLTVILTSIAGCQSAWVKSGATNDALYRDKNDCKAEPIQSYDACMQSKGWRLEKNDLFSPPPQPYYPNPYILDSAQHGSWQAQEMIAVAFDKGDGVPQNYVEAMRWYRKAAEQRDWGSAFRIGVMYHDGLGTPQNQDESMKWYLKAVEVGGAYAEYRLGEMYYKGQGVAQDDKQAVKWLRKSEEDGNSNARSLLHEISKKHPNEKKLPQTLIQIDKDYPGLSSRALPTNDLNVREFIICVDHNKDTRDWSVIKNQSGVHINGLLYEQRVSMDFIDHGDHLEIVGASFGDKISLTTWDATNVLNEASKRCE